MTATNVVPKLRRRDVEQARYANDDASVLYITDNCPVGCGHCSVDSRPDSPRITDLALFEQMVEGLARAPQRVVGITGGEPFVERRALPWAVDRLARAGKSVVLYTSGIWAVKAQAQPWVHEVLDKCACVYLSTDAFHQSGMGMERFGNAAKVVAEHAVPIVVQVIGTPAEIGRVESMLAQALGPDWAGQAEIVPTQLLVTGRAERLLRIEPRTEGRKFGRCGIARSRLVRYDGAVHACCNEALLGGSGPDWYRTRTETAEQVDASIADYAADELLTAIGTEGVGATIQSRPEFADLAERRFRSICEACWVMVDRTANGQPAGTDDTKTRRIPA